MINNGEKKKTILAVEDDFVSMLFITKLLQNLDFEVLQAVNGKEAAEIFYNCSVDLVLMDVQMPVMDGFASTKLIKQIGKDINRIVPIIALTAYALKEDREKCLEAGMNDYITKPIDINELINKVNYWLNVASMEYESYR